jgi:hypothetical protein
MMVRGVASDVGRSGVYLKQGVIRMCFKRNTCICHVRDKLRDTAERDDYQAARRTSRLATYSGTRSKRDVSLGAHTRDVEKY